MTKKKMLAFSPELSAELEKKISSYGYRTEKKKMFGHETFFVNGYMFSGANVTGIFVHIGKESRDKALKSEPDVAPFEPMEGMVIRDYLLLKEPVHANEPRLKLWLDRSYSYLKSLPPKKKKTKK